MNAIIIGSSTAEIDVLKTYLEKVSMINLVDVINNPEETVVLNRDDISVFFIAGEFIGKNAFDIFDFFESSPPVIVFSTKEDYAIKSFDAGAIDYLHLPGTLDRFLRAIKRAEIKMESIKGAEVKDMYVRSNSKSLRVPFDSVLYVEAMADYVIIQTEDCKYIVHYTMKGIQDKLPVDRFVRVHRSYIVNMDKIHAIDNQEVIIKEKRIPIGASNKDYFFSRLNMI